MLKKKRKSKVIYWASWLIFFVFCLKSCPIPVGCKKTHSGSGNKSNMTSHIKTVHPEWIDRMGPTNVADLEKLSALPATPSQNATLGLPLGRTTPPPATPPSQQPLVIRLRQPASQPLQSLRLHQPASQPSPPHGKFGRTYCNSTRAKFHSNVESFFYIIIDR